MLKLGKNGLKLCRLEHVDALLVLAAHEFRLEELGSENFALRVGDDACPHAENVRVVVEAREFAGGEVADDCRADALVLVGGHAHADARTADEDTAVRFLAGNLVADLVGKYRVVARFRRIGAHVEDFVALAFQKLDEFFLVFESGVVAADSDGLEHDNFPVYEWKSTHLRTLSGNIDNSSDYGSKRLGAGAK